MDRLKKRREFIAAAKGRRVHRPLFTLQGRPRGDELPPRAGFTVTRKVGHATERNRIRRRLKEAVRLATAPGLSGYDYVLVARRGVLSADFSEIRGEVERVFRAFHAPRVAGALPADKPYTPRGR